MSYPQQMGARLSTPPGEHGQSSTEVARAMAERSVWAQDAAQTAQRRAAASSQTTVSPIDESAEERRRWALREIAEGAGVAVRHGQARDVAFINPDGSVAVTTVHTETPVRVTPAEIWSDERDARYVARQRARENVALAGRYDLAELVEQSIITAEESRHAEVVAAAERRKSGLPPAGAMASDDYIARSVG